MTKRNKMKVSLKSTLLLKMMLNRMTKKKKLRSPLKRPKLRTRTVNKKKVLMMRKTLVRLKSKWNGA